MSNLSNTDQKWSKHMLFSQNRELNLPHLGSLKMILQWKIPIIQDFIIPYWKSILFTIIYHHFPSFSIIFTDEIPIKWSSLSIRTSGVHAIIALERQSDCITIGIFDKNYTVIIQCIKKRFKIMGKRVFYIPSGKLT